MNSAATEEELEILRIDFNRLDDDCSGTIRGSALAQLLETQLGRLPTDNEISDVLESFDIDEKGRISFDDYTQWLYPGAWPSVIAKWEAKASSSLCRLILELLPSVGSGTAAHTGDFTLIGLVFEDEEDAAGWYDGITYRNTGDLTGAVSCELRVLGEWKRVSKTQLALVIESVVSDGPDELLDQLPFSERKLRATLDEQSDDLQDMLSALGLTPTAGELQIRCYERSSGEGLDYADESAAQACETLECILVDPATGPEIVSFHMPTENAAVGNASSDLSCLHRASEIVCIP